VAEGAGGAFGAAAIIVMLSSLVAGLADVGLFWASLCDAIRHVHLPAHTVAVRRIGAPEDPGIADPAAARLDCRRRSPPWETLATWASVVTLALFVAIVRVNRLELVCQHPLTCAPADAPRPWWLGAVASALAARVAASVGDTAPTAQRGRVARSRALVEPADAKAVAAETHKPILYEFSAEVVRALPGDEARAVLIRTMGVVDRSPVVPVGRRSLPRGRPQLPARRLAAESRVRSRHFRRWRWSTTVRSSIDRRGTRARRRRCNGSRTRWRGRGTFKVSSSS
jgi:hypothetical protein